MENRKVIAYLVYKICEETCKKKTDLVIFFLNGLERNGRFFFRLMKEKKKRSEHEKK